MSSNLTYDWNGHSDMPISFPQLTDQQMAGAVRMLMRTDIGHEAIVCGARDRIMGLSKRCAELAAALEGSVEWMSCVEPHLIDGEPFKRNLNSYTQLLAKHGGAS